MNAVKVLPFYRKSSRQIDPRTKIFLTITVSTIMIAGAVGGLMNIVRPCLALLPFLLLLAVRKYRMAFGYLALYGVLFGIEYTIMPHLSGFWGFLVAGVIGVFSHMLPGALMGYFMLATTTVSEFIAAMERLHLPQKVIIPISVVFRFLPTIKEEYTAINDAMRMRGITAFRKPMDMLEYRVVPLIVSIVKIGEELSAAALTRGLGGPTQRTNICTIGFGFMDIVFFIVSLLCWAAFLLF